MTNPFKNIGNLPSKTKKLLALGVVLALFAALPLFLWAILTQRFDIRKKAVSGEPTPPPSVLWRTQHARATMQNFRITVNGKNFYDNTSSLTVHSDPGNSAYTTLEADWEENGVPMRMYIYFRNDGRNWWAEKITIYNGDNPPGQIEFNGPHFTSPMGEAFVQDTPGGFVEMDPESGRPVAEIYYDSISIQAFTQTRTTYPYPVPSATASPSSPTPTPTPPPSQEEHVLDFKFRFRGVDDESANGANLVFYFENLANNLFKQTSPVKATHIGDGIYQSLVNIPTSIVPTGGGYSIYIKGEKHLARKFCQPAGQTTRCNSTGDIYLGGPTGGPTEYTQILDFTALELEPGDLSPQDGKVDSQDFTTLLNLLSKTCSSLTEEELSTADLDYSGCVNIRDAFLLRKTLETKYDEF